MSFLRFILLSILILGVSCSSEIKGLVFDDDNENFETSLFRLPDINSVKKYGTEIFGELLVRGLVSRFKKHAANPSLKGMPILPSRPEHICWNVLDPLHLKLDAFGIDLGAEMLTDHELFGLDQMTDDLSIYTENDNETLYGLLHLKYEIKNPDFRMIGDFRLSINLFDPFDPDFLPVQVALIEAKDSEMIVKDSVFLVDIAADVIPLNESVTFTHAAITIDQTWTWIAHWNIGYYSNGTWITFLDDQGDAAVLLTTLLETFLPPGTMLPLLNLLLGRCSVIDLLGLLTGDFRCITGALDDQSYFDFDALLDEALLGVKECPVKEETTTTEQPGETPSPTTPTTSAPTTAAGMIYIGNAIICLFGYFSCLLLKLN